MRRYKLYCPKWHHIGTINADGIGEAVEIAAEHFPSYRFLSLEGRY